MTQRQEFVMLASAKQANIYLLWRQLEISRKPGRERWEIDPDGRTVHRTVSRPRWNRLCVASIRHG